MSDLSRRGMIAGAAALVRKNLSESGWKADGVFSPARKVRLGEPDDDLPAIWQQPIDAAFEIRAYVFGDETTFVRLERDAAFRRQVDDRDTALVVDRRHSRRDRHAGPRQR